MRYAVLVLATMLFPCFAIAAQVGQFINPATGDSVTVTVQTTPTRNIYKARIKTRKGNAKCLFDDVMNEEAGEGDLRYNGRNCALQVLESDERNLSVIVIGCESFCTGTATLRISHAVKQ